MTRFKQFCKAVKADRLIWTALAIMGFGPLIAFVILIVYDAAWSLHQ